MAVPTLREYFDRWQIQHHAPDLDPAGTTLLRLFLTLTYTCARPFARRNVAPDLLTVLGLVWAGLVVAVAGFSPVTAAVFVLVSVVTDGIDGCVAALNNRATQFGFVLDSVVDRLSDGLYLSALIVAGGEPAWAVAAGGALMTLEYTRARAGGAGLREVGVVTVGERPTRTVASIAGLVGAQLLPEKPWVGPNVGLAIIVVTGVLGTVQLGWYLWKNGRS